MLSSPTRFLFIWHFVDGVSRKDFAASDARGKARTMTDSGERKSGQGTAAPMMQM